MPKDSTYGGRVHTLDGGSRAYSLQNVLYLRAATSWVKEVSLVSHKVVNRGTCAWEMHLLVHNTFNKVSTLYQEAWG